MGVSSAARTAAKGSGRSLRKLRPPKTLVPPPNRSNSWSVRSRRTCRPENGNTALIRSARGLTAVSACAECATRRRFADEQARHEAERDRRHSLTPTPTYTVRSRLQGRVRRHRRSDATPKQFERRQPSFTRHGGAASMEPGTTSDGFPGPSPDARQRDHSE